MSIVHFRLKYESSFLIKHCSTYDASYLLTKYCDLISGFFPEGETCDLPMGPGRYGGDPLVSTHMHIFWILEAITMASIFKQKQVCLTLG